MDYGWDTRTALFVRGARDQAIAGFRRAGALNPESANA
jgi:hypothetical protein